MGQILGVSVADEGDPGGHGRIVPDAGRPGCNYQILGVRLARIGDGATRGRAR
jgi:hypothetical protein